VFLFVWHWQEKTFFEVEYRKRRVLETKLL